jgi:hypothetical protein
LDDVATLIEAPSLGDHSSLPTHGRPTIAVAVGDLATVSARRLMRRET